MAKTPPNDTELEASRAPFLEHLEELRRRLWRAILGIVAAAAICFAFHDPIFVFLTDPLFEVLGARNLDQTMKFRTIPGAFMFHFNTAILGGIFFGIPIVLHQAWLFVAPGLYKHERKMALPFVVLSTLCFAGGGLFGYYFVLPEAFDFMIGYTITDGAHQMVPDITVEDYLGFTSKLLLAFGIVFEMPIAVGFLSALGLLTHHILLRWWRWAIVGAFVVGAILTPPDYVTQTMLAVPLVVLYGISIGIAYLITRARGSGEGESTDAVDAEATPDGTDPVAPMLPPAPEPPPAPPRPPEA